MDTVQIIALTMGTAWASGILMIWLLPKLWRGIKQLIRSIQSLFQGNATVPATLPWSIR
jgi:hypothetical protein